ncbi:hypothetical protein GCM10020221_14910 [Streptomyces thioluteus]|uniref:Resolvase/invertase-type recombinase catalytic domain-containing protein n=1 Tax=Streptomyces thioluteus TaxID=66431 RepID=A0ABN3WKD1_STRTU
MNQSPYTARRRNIANASSGFPERVNVVAYALVHDSSSPDAVLSHLRAQAEARDWIVHSTFFDVADITSNRTDRQFWPKVERLLQDRDVTGLVARCEDEIAFYPPSKEQFRGWLLERPAFVEYVGEPPSRTVR